MCGITGFSTPSQQPLGAWFGDATCQAVHRGPDEAAYWVAGTTEPQPIGEVAAAPAGRAAFGFLRLRILDLSAAARQPMLVPGRAALVFNGEIYNYIELREALESLGHQFRSTGDTEVLLKGWTEWGEELLPRLNGMWALAVYDEARRGLFLSRDRFGEKPLFWTRWRDGIAFASEVKQLAKFPGVPIRLRPEAAAGFLATGRPYQGASSWFEGIHQVEPGTSVWIDDNGHTVRRYYDPSTAGHDVVFRGSPRAWAIRFGELLDESVRIRLRADVPVGTSLSAGVDSSMILANAMALGHERYHAFTFANADSAIDESVEAAQFARTTQATWHRVEGDGTEFATAMDQLTWHQETPVASTSLYGQWKVMQAAHEAGIRVVLDGQGADEILGGYLKFLAAAAWTGVRRSSPVALQALAGIVRQVGSVGAITRYGHRYVRRPAHAGDASQWLRPGLFDGPRTPPILVDGREMRLGDIRRWSLPNLLAYADRNSMAHSVEVRLPFLDPSVVAFALAMPDRVLLRNGWTKWPLRYALSARGGRGPAWTRGKRWFTVTQGPWLRTALAPLLADWRRQPHPAWTELVDWPALEQFLGRWEAGEARASWDEEVFHHLALERFLRVWLPA
jgi:asparagine synthase (glutamine-hydrolysing)